MPELPSLPHLFVDDGRIDRSKESFQGTAIKRVEQSPDSAISFFRSDFRGALIQDCRFHGNNFSRADFISTRFENTHFLECDFLTSYISNSVFSKCRFEGNKDFNPDIFRSDLFDCDFVNQSVDRALWRDSRFTGCRFKNFSIERSTIENTSFIDCDLSGVDLSQLSAMDIAFENCQLNGTVIDPDYLGSYFFVETALDNITFAYRTQDLQFSLSQPSDISSLGQYLESQGRWSEAFNLRILGMTIHPDAFQGRPLVEDWMIYLLKSIQLPIPSDAAENTARMFRIAKFYLASGAVCISDALMFLSFAGEISRTKLNGLVYETLLTGRAALLGALHNLKDFETLLAKDRHGKMSFRFQVQVESADEMAVEADFRAIMDTVASRTGMAYQILRVGYGSILIEAIATFVGIMVFFRAARSVSYNLAEIRVAHQAGKRCAELARNAQDAQKAAKAIELFRESLPPEPPVSEILVDEVAEMGDSIASLTKSIRAAGSDILGLVKEVRVFMDDVNKGS